MVKILECTLRDGGYINNWEFGEKAIEDMTRKLEATHVEILELGFLKDEPYKKDRTVFNDMAQVTKLIGKKEPGVQYAVMCEVVNPLPLEKLATATDETADIIRVIVWKDKHDKDGNVVDALEEGYHYCKGIVEKGYKLCVQPARVDQYSDDEFVAMVKMFETLNPMAIYVVDSWGTQTSEQILHYAKLADQNMKPEIALGYHGHNNLMQAFATAAAFIRLPTTRDLIVDASIYGIGRGAGNLNAEIFAKYMNEQNGASYQISPMIFIYETYIKSIYSQHPWGYSMPYYLTAQYNCNPNYGEYYGLNKRLSSVSIEHILQTIEGDDNVLYSKAKADNYLKKYQLSIQ